MISHIENYVEILRFDPFSVPVIISAILSVDARAVKRKLSNAEIVLANSFTNEHCSGRTNFHFLDHKGVLLNANLAVLIVASLMIIFSLALTYGVEKPLMRFLRVCYNYYVARRKE